ncbi:hsp90 co-chaperone Cdc37 [Microbotryomycetes sp. JL221]|nr:hsp90 co-chaperone Cdc37 [Microbotryomycetes sp. JL221]
MPLNYNKWDKLELSDDSDIEVHPNVDKKSMIRWKQRDIHEKREIRKLKLHHLEAETTMNNELLERMNLLRKSMQNEGSVNFVEREVSRLQTIVPDFKTKQFKEGEQPSQDHMVLSLLSQIWNAVNKQPDQQDKDKNLIKELDTHIERLKQRQQDIIKEQAEIQDEQKKYITMDDLHTGFETKTMISSKPSAQPIASTSKPSSSKSKSTETTIETLNSPAVQAGSSTTTSDDSDEDVPELTPEALKFSQLPSLDFKLAFEQVSNYPNLLKEETTDALLVEAFQMAMKGKDRRARECVEKGLMVQYCRSLGKDGVALFFQRMTSNNPQALKVFLEDVAKTSERIIARARVVAKEKQDSNDNEGSEAREQIQLVASDPSTVITFEIPDGPPPENLEITGEGSEQLDPELVKDFLQKRWEIFESFSKGLKKALQEKSLEKVNKVLGKLSVEDAEEVVKQLQESGILSFAQNDIIDTTNDNNPLGDRVPVQVEAPHVHNDETHYFTILVDSLTDFKNKTVGGFLLIKCKIMDPSHTKACAAIILYMTLPALLFAKIVPSFNSQNISQLGPLFLTAFFYIILSKLLGILARAFTPTPRKFRYGILAAYAYSNWGDLPTAIMQTLAVSAPFKGQSDEALAIAYISIFILANNLAMWPFKGLEVVRWDYTTIIDPVEEFDIENGQRGFWIKWAMRLRRGKPLKEDLEQALLQAKGKAIDKQQATKQEIDEEMSCAMNEVMQIQAPSTREPALGHVSTRQSSEASTHPSAIMRVVHSIVGIIKSIASPPICSLFLALIIALVPQLKTLFVYSSDTTWHPIAPDNQPPLAILYQTTQFVGAASIPLGLTVLGASLAKIEIPRPLTRLPWSSMFAMTFVKLVLVPIIGFLFVSRLSTVGGIVSHDNHVLRFTLTYLSCTPTGTIQIAYSALFAGHDRQDNTALLSSYLLLQYIAYAVASPVVTALALNLIF